MILRNIRSAAVGVACVLAYLWVAACADDDEVTTTTTSASSTRGAGGSGASGGAPQSGNGGTVSSSGGSQGGGGSAGEGGSQVGGSPQGGGGSGGAGGSGGGTGGTGGSGGSGGAGTGGSGGSGTGGSGGGGGAPTVLLTNNDNTCMQHGVEPYDASEYGHWAAAKLTPPSYPFTVSHVAYRLFDFMTGMQCSDLAHDVMVFTSTSATPPATPTVIELIGVPPGSINSGWVTLSLTNPLTINAGEHLYVAVEMAGSGSQYMCIGACSGPAFKLGFNFWSNATSPAFPWADLASFGLPYNYQIEAW